MLLFSPESAAAVAGVFSFLAEATGVGIFSEAAAAAGSQNVRSPIQVPKRPTLTEVGSPPRSG